MTGELDWLAERYAAAQAQTTPASLHAAQHAVKKHAKLKAEIAGRRPLVERVLKQGQGLMETQPKQNVAKVQFTYIHIVLPCIMVYRGRQRAKCVTSDSCILP